MAQITVTLSKGITVGDTVHDQAVLRAPTALDVIQAAADAERVVMVPKGVDANGEMVLEPQLVASPTMAGINVLRAQIVSIGTFKAPIDDLLFSKMSPADLNILQVEALQLERTSLEVAQRGRLDRSGADTAQSD